MINSTLSTSLPPFRRLAQLKTAMSISTTVKDPEAQAVRHLCRALPQLQHLRALRISAQCMRLFMHGPTTLERFFLSCPRSLVMLMIEHWEDGLFGSMDASLDPVQGRLGL
ncbi:hypothetical protein BGZ47_000830 [Haplosporangium gracile]|nr:hypothetical protein BGZ47_000830 [Haplosporangium gracile]